MVDLQDRADQDLAQEIAAVVRRAFRVTATGDLIAQARYDEDAQGWMVRHWHDGRCYDLTMCEVGQVLGLWANGAWLGGIGRLLTEDTPWTVAMRFLLLVHGGVRFADPTHAEVVCRRLTPE
jgi:hypothetical protein